MKNNSSQTPPPHEGNIGANEQRKRRILGIVSLSVGVGLAFVLVIMGAGRAWRLIVFFPIWLAGLGLLQARAKTCIALAARGTCNMDAGVKAIDDAGLVERLRATAKSIHRRALVTAAIITIVTFVFPVLGK